MYLYGPYVSCFILLPDMDLACTLGGLQTMLATTTRFEYHE